MAAQLASQECVLGSNVLRVPPPEPWLAAELSQDKIAGSIDLINQHNLVWCGAAPLRRQASKHPPYGPFMVNNLLGMAFLQYSNCYLSYHTKLCKRKFQ